MDMIDQRIRDAVATLLSRGARALERTAGELEQAAEDLRRRVGGDDPDRVWSEPDDTPDTVVRGAPLRAVPDTPTDAPGERRVPPVRPPRTPGLGDTGHVSADAGPSPVGDPGLMDARAATPRGEGGAGVVSADGATAPDGTAQSAVDTAPGGGPGDVTPAERLRTMASGTVSQIRAQLGELSPDELRTLREIEVGNRNRTTLLTAIDRELDTAG